MAPCRRRPGWWRRSLPPGRPCSWTPSASWLPPWSGQLPPSESRRVCSRTGAGRLCLCCENRSSMVKPWKSICIKVFQCCVETHVITHVMLEKKIVWGDGGWRAKLCVQHVGLCFRVYIYIYFFFGIYFGLHIWQKFVFVKKAKQITENSISDLNSKLLAPIKVVSMDIREQGITPVSPV